MCLGNISKDLTTNNLKKAGLNRHDYEFFVDCNVVDTSNIINIKKYLMKRHDIK